MKFLYPFEDEGPEPLSYLPLCIRYRLDLAGRHLSLKAWQALPLSDRQALCALAIDMDCELSRWEAALLATLQGAGFEPPGNCPALCTDEFGAETVPALVAAHLQPLSSESGNYSAHEGGAELKAWLARWQRLTEIERYALWKTAQSKRGAALFRKAAGYFGFENPTGVPESR